MRDQYIFIIERAQLAQFLLISPYFCMTCSAEDFSCFD